MNATNNTAEFQENNTQTPRSRLPKGVKCDKMTKMYAATLPKSERRYYIRSQCAIAVAEQQRARRSTKTSD